MAKKSNAARIRTYMAAHPAAKPADVAAKFGVSKAYVYVIRSKTKKAAINQELTEAGWQVVHVSTSNKSAEEPEVYRGAIDLAPPPATTDVDATLAERGKRYGTFKGHAEVTIGLKKYINSALFLREKKLDPDQQEALDMICHKIGRIVNGDANYADSWIDIAGYAKLVADRLETGKEV